MNEPEIDMDELEARLYGQVYHVSAANEELATSCNIINDAFTKNVPRYFEDHSSRSQGTVYQIPPPFYDTMGFYPFSPVNNIVVLPPPQPQVFARPQQDSQKWLEKLLRKYEKGREIRKQKRARKRKLLEQKGKPNQQKEDVVEKIVAIEEEVSPSNDSVLIIDDDSDASTNLSDVILVETPTEIISVDCEDMEPVESNSEENATKRKDNWEAASTTSSTVDYTENFCGNKLLGDFNARASTSFSDLNLDSFTNYIECNGKTTDGIPTLSSTFLEDNSKKRKEVAANSSDSSSESEFEDYEHDLEEDGDIDISIYDKTDGSPIQALTHKKINEDIISVDCEDDTPKSKKIKLVETLIEEKFSGTSTPKKDGDVIFIDDDSKSSTEVCLQKSDLININSDKILNVEGGSSTNYSGRNYIRSRFMDYWTEDMDSFYRNSWGHEEYSVIEEQRKMSDDPDMWKIISRDKINLNYLSRDVRCRRCREFGHIAVKCTKRLDPPKCILCGDCGHRESRCPYKLCTSCGRESSYFTTYCSACTVTRNDTCSICTMKGHHFYKCPDLWRRYLFTTTEGPLVIEPLAACVKQVSDQWCSGCGANGHLEQNCGYYNRTHMPASVRIHCYSDVYNGQVLPHLSLRSAKSSKPQPTKPQPTKSQPIKPQPTKPQPTKSQPSPRVAKKVNSPIVYSINLSRKNEMRLKKSTLVETVMKSLKVDVTINELKCYISGSKKAVHKAKDIFSRFLRIASLFRQLNVNFSFISNPDVRRCLQKNFNYLQNPYINWKMVAKNIYDSIKQDRSRIKYKQLNSIINAKLLLGPARNHMKILQQCLSTKSGLNKESFHYIFNNGNPISENYNHLINQLHSKTDKVIRIEIETLNNKAVRELNQSDAKKIDRLHSLVLITNYSDSTVSKFMNEARRLSIAPTEKYE